MRKAGLEEAQAGIKIARRNINNLRYANDTTLMAEIEEKKKHIILTIWHFVRKVMSLLFNMLSKLTIAFLPRS